VKSEKNYCNYTVNIVLIWWDLYRMQFTFDIQVLQKLVFKVAPRIWFVPQQISNTLQVLYYLT